MKNLIIVLIVVVSIVSCKNNAKEEIALTTISGEFIYLDGNAVINTGRDVYGVTIDDTMEALDQQAMQYKKDDFDFVNVTVKAIIQPREDDGEGWSNVLTIKEILSVAPLSAENNIITIQSKEE